MGTYLFSFLLHWLQYLPIQKARFDLFDSHYKRQDVMSVLGSQMAINLCVCVWERNEKNALVKWKELYKQGEENKETWCLSQRSEILPLPPNGMRANDLCVSFYHALTNIDSNFIIFCCCFCYTMNNKYIGTKKKHNNDPWKMNVYLYIYLNFSFQFIISSKSFFFQVTRKNHRKKVKSKYFTEE